MKRKLIKLPPEEAQRMREDLLFEALFSFMDYNGPMSESERECLDKLIKLADDLRKEEKSSSEIEAETIDEDKLKKAGEYLGW